MKNVKIVIVGGGWAGCSAALSAAKAGAQVTLLERTDMILGTGLVGGIMRNNGRYTATEEIIAMGGGDLFKICDETSRHKDIEFPGHKHASLYDIAKTPVAIEKYLLDQGIKIIYESRVVKAQMDGRVIIAVEDQNGKRHDGDMFVDSTGTAGPMNNCSKFGNGCAMCVLRCPTYGGRVSLAGLAGAKEVTGKKKDGTLGAMSGSCKIYKESLSNEIQEVLNKSGVAVIPVPKDLAEDHLDQKACQQYALKEFKDNLIFLDTGHAKFMTPFYSIHKLRQVPGCENARYEDPYSGGKGNSVRYFNMAPRDNSLKVIGVDNLFCCGEKAGLLVGHTEAMVTGLLAGLNSVRQAIGLGPIEIDESTAVGDAISFVNSAMQTEDGMGKKYTFSGSVYFERMKEKGLYSIDKEKIARRVDKVGLTGIFDQKLL